MTYRFESNGKKVSLLGYGAMRLPTVDGAHAAMNRDGCSSAAIDQKELNRQVKALLDGGVTYFDTSPAYCRGESERCLGEALAKSGYPRESYLIATKMSNFAPSQWPLEEGRKMFENSLKYLKTDYVDNYLLHSIGNDGLSTFRKRYVDNGAADWAAGERAAGRIRNLGFSFHGDYRAFEWCLENHSKYRWDFAMIQMNYVDWKYAARLNKRNVNAEKLYSDLVKLNIPVIVMEPLLGGRLAKFDYALARHLTPLDSEATLASWAFRFCASKPAVMTILSGMTRTEHIVENIKTFSPFKPLSEKELAALDRAAADFVDCDYVQCNRCNYCMPCPYGLDIPEILTFRNSHLSRRLGEKRDARAVLAAYAKAIPDPLRRAERCTGCAKCNTHCPQQIDIPREIAEIDRAIDALRDEEARR